jgi:hypothetical protein
VVGSAERDATAIWTAVDRLVDATPDLAQLVANRIHLLAARRWRELGRQLPPELEAEVRHSALVSLLVPQVLARVRDACEGVLVVHKGPEIARHYADPTLRPFMDLDLLVRDAVGVQAALVGAGFVEVGDPAKYVSAPHRQPIEWPGLPLHVEIHDAPNWPVWLGRPPTEEMLDRVVPSTLSAGLDTLSPEDHALTVAVHAWAHGPLAQVRDLVDVAAMSSGLDPDVLRERSRAWEIEGLWQTTIGGADAVLFGTRKPVALRVWARNLPAVRERTVLETHLARWFAGFSALGPIAGFRVMGSRFATDIRPRDDETWSVKLRRSRRALRNALVRKSEHDDRSDKQVGRR